MQAVQRCLLLLLILGGTLPAIAAVKPTASANRLEKFYKKLPGLAGITAADYTRYTPREYERATGKKLRLKEKIVYKVIRWKLKKEPRSAPTDIQRTLGILSLIFGALGFALIFVPSTIGIVGVVFAIAGFILGLKSLKGNSNAPGLIGLILSSVVLFVVILAVLTLTHLFE